MNASPGLPEEVITAIRAGRKIDAIKLLRESRDLGLKEAKHAVDAYIRANPSVQPPPQPSANTFVLIMFLLLLGYIGYQLLT